MFTMETSTRQEGVALFVRTIGPLHPRQRCNVFKVLLGINEIVRALHS